jgi:hypothetical protein
MKRRSRDPGFATDRPKVGAIAMMRGLILWLLGVPASVVVLLFLFHVI